MVHRIGLATLVAAVLCGCSSLSQTECQSADWKTIGYEDGARGARQARAEEHRKSCAKHGVAFEREDWEHGSARGLEIFCTPQNAVRIGLRGGENNGVCPPEAELEFGSHWRAGRVVWEQRQRLGQLENRRRELDYAYGSANSDQDRYAIRVELARVDEQLRYESARLRDEEARLAEFLRGLP